MGHTCENCGNTYQRKNGLQKHLRKCTAQQPAQEPAQEPVPTEEEIVMNPKTGRKPAWRTKLTTAQVDNQLPFWKLFIMYLIQMVNSREEPETLEKVKKRYVSSSCSDRNRTNDLYVVGRQLLDFFTNIIKLPVPLGYQVWLSLTNITSFLNYKSQTVTSPSSVNNHAKIILQFYGFIEVFLILIFL